MRIVSITLRIAFFFIILKESVKKSRILAARSFHSMPFMGLLLQVRDVFVYFYVNIHINMKE